MTYDAAGRLVLVTDGLQHSSAFVYADPDYPWKASVVALPLTQHGFDLDANGNLVGYTDPAGNRWDYVYDSQNNLTQALQPPIPNEPARRRTDWFYDARDNLIAMHEFTAAVNFVQTQFEHDQFGQVIRVTNPLGRVTTYTNDAHGNLVRVVTAAGRQREWLYEAAETTLGFTRPNAVIDGLGRRTSLLRDAWGRLLVKDYPTDPDAQYSYDALGRLVRMVDGSGTTGWSYDANGRLRQETTGVHQAQYDYHPNGLRARMTSVRNSGVLTLDYFYDGANRLELLVQNGQTTGFSYDSDSRLLRRDLPNAASTAYKYEMGLLKSITHFDAGMVPFRSFAYDYWENGLVKQVTELDGSLVFYTYDFQDRLLGESRTGFAPTYTFEWTYDAAGNRLTQSRDGVLTIYLHDPDDLVTQAGTATFVWDANFNLNERLQQAVSRFHYDQDDRLVGIVEGQTPFRAYQYDGLGRRIRREVLESGRPFGSTRYGHDGELTVTEESLHPLNGPSAHATTWADGLVSYCGPTCQRVAMDGTGSVRGWTDDSGQPGPYQSVFNACGEAVLEKGPRPPYGFGADSGVLRSEIEGDSGLLLTPSGGYDPRIARDVNERDAFAARFADERDPYPEIARLPVPLPYSFDLWPPSISGNTRARRDSSLLPVLVSEDGAAPYSYKAATVERPESLTYIEAPGSNSGNFFNEFYVLLPDEEFNVLPSNTLRWQPTVKPTRRSSPCSPLQRMASFRPRTVSFRPSPP